MDIVSTGVVQTEPVLWLRVSCDQPALCNDSVPLWSSGGCRDGTGWAAI